MLDGTLENSYEPFKYSLLNESQNEAVESAVGATKFHLIQGPPGTGKTTTIAQLAKVFWIRVSQFCDGSTHTAINNCLNAVAKQVGDETRVLKIESTRGAEILKGAAITKMERYPHFQYSMFSESSESGIVIGGTPFACAIRLPKDWITGSLMSP